MCLFNREKLLLSGSFSQVSAVARAWLGREPERPARSPVERQGLSLAPSLPSLRTGAGGKREPWDSKPPSSGTLLQDAGVPTSRINTCSLWWYFRLRWGRLRKTEEGRNQADKPSAATGKHSMTQCQECECKSWLCWKKGSGGKKRNFFLVQKKKKVNPWLIFL